MQPLGVSAHRLRTPALTCSLHMHRAPAEGLNLRYINYDSQPILKGINETAQQIEVICHASLMT